MITSAPSEAPPPADAGHFPWMLADIGGTNARFGWVEHAGAPITHPVSLRVAEYAGPRAAAEAYLALVAQATRARRPAPRAAAWAAATAVIDDRIEFTNSGWTFSRTQVQRELGLDTLLVLNDFEALALSLPRLGEAQLRRIGPATPEAVAATTPAQASMPDPNLPVMAVVGPGTGLGVAGLVACGHPPVAAGRLRWRAIPGEGGHASLAPADDFESELLAAVRKHFAHVSAERLLSGIGLPVLHRAVAEVRGVAAAPLPADAIVTAGVAAPGSAGADALCRETLEHFCALLGGFAGNVALTLGARGGLYVGGGIVPRLGALFFESRFRARFEAKGRFESYLRAIPTWLIVDTRAALTGTLVALQQSRV